MMETMASVVDAVDLEQPEDFREWASGEIDAGRWTQRRMADAIGVPDRTLGHWLKQVAGKVSIQRAALIEEGVRRLWRRESGAMSADDLMAEEAAKLILRRPSDAGCDLSPLEYWRAKHADGWSQGEIGELIGYNASVVSKVFAGSYEGNFKAVERAMADAQVRVLGASGGAKIATRATKLLEKVLAQAAGSPWLTVVHGAPGMGKTEVLREASLRGRDVVMCTLDMNATGPTALRSLARALGVEKGGSGEGLTRAIIESLRGEPRLVVWDETNNLADNARRAARFLNAMRQINDEACCGMVFVGTSNIAKCLRNPANEDVMEMLLSRMELQVALPSANLVEVRALVTAHFGTVDERSWRVFAESFEGQGREVSMRRAAVFVQQARRMATVLGMVPGAGLTPELVRKTFQRIGVVKG